MDLKKSKRLLLLAAAVYWLFAVGIFVIAGEQFRRADVTGDAPEAQLVVGELVDGMELRQTLESSLDVAEALQIMVGTYNRENTGTLILSVLDEKGSLLLQQTVPARELENDAFNTVTFDQPLALGRGRQVTLTVTTAECTYGNAVTVYAGGGEIPQAQVNGAPFEGALCVRFTGYNELTFYRTYWLLTAAVFLAAVIYTLICWRGLKRGRTNSLVSILTVYTRYGFLVRQLVARDFKTKYKRSSLGMAWSIMNPMLTMAVQYVVFSTLFKSDIPNYLVYLLTGIVFFSFFNEAVTLGMTAITGNAALIKKVYMPKVIYPFSRILSSCVNFLLALIPLFVVVIVTGTALRPSLFLLIFDVLCLLGFIVGMTLLLSTAMTFFQDTLFLWNVVGMLWQYLTPIFYPETIIPEAFRPLYRMNPLYQFISFARTCIIDGISPAPAAYFGCLLSALAALLAGAAVFKRCQGKFVLYL